MMPNSYPREGIFNLNLTVIKDSYILFQITRLKIARNPFAKGFREAGKCRYVSSSCNELLVISELFE